MATFFTSNPGVRGEIVWNKAIDMKVMAPGTTTMYRYIDITLVETPYSLEGSSKNVVVGAFKLRHWSVFARVDRERRLGVRR